MPSAKLYWQRVRQVEQKLPPDVWLYSLENLDKGTKAGAVCSAKAEIAARCIVDGTHRQATDEEVAAHKDQIAQQTERTLARDRKKAPKTVLVVGSEEASALLPETGAPAARTRRSQPPAA